MRSIHREILSVLVGVAVLALGVTACAPAGPAAATQALEPLADDAFDASTVLEPVPLVPRDHARLARIGAARAQAYRLVLPTSLPPSLVRVRIPLFGSHVVLQTQRLRVDGPGRISWSGTIQGRLGGYASMAHWDGRVSGEARIGGRAYRAVNLEGGRYALAELRSLPRAFALVGPIGPSN